MIRKNQILHLLIIVFFFCISALFLIGCGISPKENKLKGPVHITYWEKWTGFEGDAMKKVVQTFNESQDKIYVELLTVSEIDRKTLVAIAGGDPPDVAGLWCSVVATFADKNALLPLDEYAAKAGIKQEDYIPSIWNLGIHRRKLYALPTTPATVALHWNKDMFREAGLDPERPPRTLQELDQYSRKLTKRDKKGNIIQSGFIPIEPGWWNWSWGYWFGGKLWNGKDRITCNSPENIKAYEWIQSYSRDYGIQNLQSFRSGFGNFSSPQNPFLSGKVAMEMQGVWMYNFINNFSPNLKWGCAPFPSALPGLNNVTYIETDSLCIPRGAQHPDEAFEFIKFVNSQKGFELLNMGQRKFSPLKKVSDEFIKNHPHPYIQTFIDLAHSPNTFSTLDMSIWNEYIDEMNVAFDNIWLQKSTPKEALDLAQSRIQKKWDKELNRFRRLGWLIEPVPPGR